MPLRCAQDQDVAFLDDAVQGHEPVVHDVRVVGRTRAPAQDSSSAA